MSARWEPSIEDFIDVATYLLGADRVAIARLLRLALAESALHAPFASHGGVEANATLVEQAAVLLERLAMNHRLPDANMRAAFLLTARFLDANGLTWRSREADTDAALIERVAAREARHEEVVAWDPRAHLRDREMSRVPSPESAANLRRARTSTRTAEVA